MPLITAPQKIILGVYSMSVVSSLEKGPRVPTVKGFKSLATMIQFMLSSRVRFVFLTHLLFKLVKGFVRNSLFFNHPLIPQVQMKLDYKGQFWYFKTHVQRQLIKLSIRQGPIRQLFFSLYCSLCNKGASKALLSKFKELFT